MTLSHQEISDRLEIEQLLVRYCDCPVVLDRGNGETQMPPDFRFE
jgi:hypothetical protein